MRPIPLPALAFLVLGAPAVAAGPVYQTFGAWTLACDNGHRCTAIGFLEGRHADLQVDRDAGPAAARITLIVEEGVDPTPVRADGVPVSMAGWTAGEQETSLSTNDPALVTAFLRQIGGAHRLEAGEGVVPLDGMNAALRRMDTIQGRAGTPTPLRAATGTAPVPAAPPLPPRPAWLPPRTGPRPGLAAAARRRAKALLAAEDCDRPGEDDDAYALDDRHDLVLLACRRYAYQSSALPLIVPRDGGPVQPFRPRLPLDKDPMTLLVEPGFDPADGSLGFASKGRGIADCGISATWAWSAGQFRLIGMTWLAACGSVQTGNWPTLVRTAPARR